MADVDYMDDFKTSVTRLLDQMSISYKIKRHSAPVFTCEDAARERGVKLSQIIKCMIGIDDKKRLYVMLIPGDRLLKLKKIRQIAGGIRIDLVPPERLSKEYDVVVGAISPTQFLGIPNCSFYIDDTVFLEEYADISSGDPRAGIELKTSDLERVINAIRCDIISSNQS